MPWELGVPGAAEGPPAPFPPAPAVPPPLELSLLFWPVESCKRFRGGNVTTKDYAGQLLLNVLVRHFLSRTPPHFSTLGESSLFLGQLTFKLVLLRDSRARSSPGNLMH